MKRFLQKKLATLIGLCCMLVAVPVWATIAVAIEPAIVPFDAQVTLSLTYDPRHVQGLPDLSPLEQNFTILGTQHNTSYRIINGQPEANAQWQIMLQPKKTGILLIPPIRIGQQSSTALQLTVTPGAPSSGQAATASPPNNKAAVAKLTATVSPSSPYLHQEVRYTVQLWSQQPLINAQYRHPTAEDAIVLPLGDGRQLQRQVAGVLYHIDEQQYAIFPQKSGALTISPPVLRAMVYDIPPKPLTLQAKALQLSVRPLPPTANMQSWLPSKLVRLRESYDKPDLTLSQGTTIVRTIHIQAQGLVAKLLPELPIKEEAGLRVYASNPETDNDLQQGELWGSMTQKLSYVVTKPGEVTLPALKVPWFNVVTTQMEIAELPARTLHVTAITATQKKPPQNNQAPIQAVRPLRASWLSDAPWRIIGVILVCIVLGYVQQKNNNQPYRRLRSACRAHDAALAKVYLLAWMRQVFPKHPNLHLTDIGYLTEDMHLQEQVSLLNTCLYQPNSCPWQGKALWQAVKHYRKKTRSCPKTTGHLPSINPEGVL